MKRLCCWRCGYSLRGLPTGICPECGNGPKPQQPAPPDVDITSQIAGLVGFAEVAVYAYAALIGVGVLLALLTIMIDAVT